MSTLQGPFRCRNLQIICPPGYLSILQSICLALLYAESYSHVSPYRLPQAQPDYPILRAKGARALHILLCYAMQ